MPSHGRRLLIRLSGCVALILAVLALSLMPALLAQADTGPKPKMTFTFQFQGDAIAIVGGQQIECQDDQCADGKPLEEHGPQRFWCDAAQCSSMAYGYAPYHKIVVQFADRTRESNVFGKEAFSAEYTVSVLAESLLVKEKASGPLDRLACASATVPVLAIGLGLLRYSRRRSPAPVDDPRQSS